MRRVLDWIVRTGDHAALPFLIVDKRAAQVHAFDPQGRWRASAPALVGLAPGDETAPGVGTRALALIQPSERTTPAGRFMASLDDGAAGHEILWIDYDAGIALHRVSNGLPRERRLQRLASPVAADHRITFGCVNVPVRFFDEVVAPAFRHSSGIVYVLPDSRSDAHVFGSQLTPPLQTPD